MSRGLLFIGLILLSALPVHGQVVLSVAQPVIDSFPIVDIAVNITDSGGPATLVNSSNFSVREDGIPATVLGLHDCDGASNAAIVFIIDTSESMNGSLGSGPFASRSYGMFDHALSQFLSSIPGASSLALVPFADTASYSYPGSPSNFYASNITADTTALMAHVTAFRYVGTNTEVDPGIAQAAQLLTRNTLPRRVMVLVTDAPVDEADSVQLYLDSLGIQLYVLDVDRDSAVVDYANHDLAIGTGGAYFKAYDTTLYAPMLLDISNLIFSEHCILEYRSLLPCPNWNTHQVEVSLNYNGTTEQAFTSYTLGRVTHDSLPPRLALDTPGMFSRVLHAYEFSACEGRMKSLTDSASSNFIVMQLGFSPDSATDSLSVIDTLFPAEAYFVATDSSGNISRIDIHYQPEPDIHAPQFGAPMHNANSIVETIEEMLPWDRGIDTIYLSAGAKNILLDSIHYAGNRLAHAYLQIVSINDSAHGCIVAIDSVGNTDSICIESGGTVADTLPPLFVQDPIAEPRLTLSGKVTDMRPHDRGIREVILTPLSNTAAPQVFYDSSQEARVGVSLLDSMYPARALVEAYDSAGNFLRDSLRYEPLPDTTPPLISVTTPTNFTFIFYATDTQAWDRGIASLALLPSSVNASSSPAMFLDGHRATLTATITDQTQNATMIVQAVDSAGNQTTRTVTYSGNPLIPLGDSIIDFGTVSAPATITRSIALTNRNDVPVTVNVQSMQGDAAEFTMLTPSPLTFSAYGSQIVEFEFHPSLIGTYKASAILQGVDTLGSFTLLGRSTGTIQLALDTTTVTVGGKGELHLSIDVVPKPSNLDTIGFTLTYDPNFLTFGDPENCPNGSLDTGICNYRAFWSGGTDGNRQAMLIRTDTTKISTLSFGHTELTFPFQTYVSTNESTAVHILPLATYSATVGSVTDGLVIAQDTCATETLRSAMMSQTPFKIISINPDPAQSSLTVSVESATESDAEICIVSSSGITEHIFPCHFSAGEQSVLLPELPGSSGMYEIVIKENGKVMDRQPIEIVH